MSAPSAVAAIGTYLPPWGGSVGRAPGPDEDAVTVGVAAARAALTGADHARISSVVLITREFPLLVGGNGAALLTGVGLPHDVLVAEHLGGAPAVIDALSGASTGTLVVAVDAAEGGAAGAAALVGESGTVLSGAGRIVRSLPVTSRARGDAGVRDYSDPRLLRERGTGVALELLELSEKPIAIAGLADREARAHCAGRPAALPTTGAASALFALAALDGDGGLVVAVEQASATAVWVEGRATVHRDEPAATASPSLTWTPGPEIGISLAAYERAFEPKLRWEAARCGGCGTLALPARYRCVECGSEDDWSTVPLPRTGEVYTTVTVHVPVPGLPTPYSLAVVQLDGVDVRALVKVTGVPAGAVSIGDRGRLVLRRVAVRTGVPDYAYALLPDPAATSIEGAA